MSQITKVITSLTLCLLLITPASAFTLQNRSSKVRVSAQRRTRVNKDLAKERREEAFQLVWQTINDENFDPTFGGVNWAQVRARYAPRVAQATSDYQLHLLLQQMLNEIPQSHFAIIPPEEIPRIKPRKKLSGKASGTAATEAEAALSDEEENESDNEIATRMLNGIGVDVRIMNGQVVITRVDADGAAAKAGLRPGFSIKSVDNMSLADIPAGADITPGLHLRLRQRVLVDYLGGEPGTDVHLSYLDAENKEHQVVIKRERLKGALSSAVGTLPPAYTELEAKRLPDNIGYIRFNLFAPQLAEKICGAVKSMRDAPGLIIDLRGNPGGVMGMASGLVGLLTKKTGLIGVIRTRTGILPIPAFPQKSSFAGPLVVLIDRLSGSTAEVMAAALQESGRALIIGERSAGEVLGANIKRLPTGALFEYAQGGFTTSNGTTLEGKGVTPDVEKKLDRNSLLKGEDDQLQEAIKRIQQHPENPQNALTVKAPPSPPPPVEITVTTKPPARAEQEKEATEPTRPAPFKSTPQADAVMERYIKAVGGREALARLTSRISTGICKYPFQSLSGKIVIYEQAPDKRSMEIEIPNLGVTKIVFDGQRGWMQDSLMGFYEYSEPMLTALRRDFDFYKITKYRELYSEMSYKGMIDSSQGRVEILEVATPDGARDELHFDAQTGLLVYGDGAQLGDYRQVGDVKIPFLIVVLLAGQEMRIQLQQVSHNVPISADAFAEPRSCFNGQ